jgi:hypothetical protein
MLFEGLLMGESKLPSAAWMGSSRLGSVAEFLTACLARVSMAVSRELIFIICCCCSTTPSLVVGDGLGACAAFKVS